ncbi:hypothetical protein U1Q18_019897 [Sarracenia purpurea var. burkii]
MEQETKIENKTTFNLHYTDARVNGKVVVSFSSMFCLLEIMDEPFNVFKDFLSSKTLVSKNCIISVGLSNGRPIFAILFLLWCQQDSVFLLFYLTNKVNNATKFLKIKLVRLIFL